jgi:conjugative element/phage-associated large polyvalent protein/ParB-like nuclease family protein
VVLLQAQEDTSSGALDTINERIARELAQSEPPPQGEPTKPGEEAPPADEGDAIDRDIAAALQVRPPSTLEKVVTGAATTLGSAAQFPDLLLRELEHVGIPRATILQAIPNLAAGAQKLAGVGREIQDAANELSPPGSRPDDFLGRLPYDVGGFLPLLASSAVGGEALAVAGAPLRIGQAIGSAGMGAAQVSVPMYHDILAATGDESKALTGAAIGMGVGALQAKGIGGILSKLEEATGGGVMRYLTQVATGAVEQGAVQATQQALLDAARTHLTGEDMSYLDRLQRTGRAGVFGLLFGGIVGGALHGLHAAGEAASGAVGRGRRTVADIGPETASAGPQPSPPPAEAGVGVSRESPAPGAQATVPAISAERPPSAAPSTAAGTPGPGPAEAQTYAHTEEPAANSSVQPTDVLSKVELVPVDQPKPFNSRNKVEEAKVEALMAEMQAGKPLPPIIVSVPEPRPDQLTRPVAPEDQLVIDDGQHRLEAARRLGLTHVPVRVVFSAEQARALAPVVAPEIKLESGKRLSVPIMSEGKRVGSVLGQVSPDVVHVFASRIEEAHRGRGLASSTYEAIARKALESGRELWSDNVVSLEAARVYDSLERKGFYVERAPDARRIEKPPGERSEMGPALVARGPVFRVTEGPKVRALGGEGEAPPSQAPTQTQPVTTEAPRGEESVALPEYAQRAIHEASMQRRTNEGGSIEAPDPFAGGRWLERDVKLSEITANPRNKGVGTREFTHRGSVTKGPIVIDDRGEVIDGNNRVHEALLRGDSNIAAYVFERGAAGGAAAPKQPEELSRPLTPEEEASDRILRGEHLTPEELAKVPKAIQKASERAQRGEKPRPKMEKKPEMGSLEHLREIEKAQEAMPIKVSLEDVPKDLATRAFQNTSHTPEERGASVQRDYVRAMEAAHERLAPLADTPEKRALLASELEGYRGGYLKRLRAYLEAHSRTASPMITGPANFPVERNRKAGNVADKRAGEFSEYQTRAVAAIAKKLTTEQRAAELEARHPGRESREVPFEGGVVRLDHETDRLRIHFDEKPGPETIKSLRQAGYKWAPSVGAWQRQWTLNAELATERLLGVPINEKTPSLRPEPWEMTREEWNRAYEAARAETFGAAPTKASPTAEAARVAERERLRFGAQSSTEPDSAFYGPVTHRRVVEKALAEGLPVPERVLAEYPDLGAEPAPATLPTPPVPIREQSPPVAQAAPQEAAGESSGAATGTGGPAPQEARLRASTPEELEAEARKIVGEFQPTTFAPTPEQTVVPADPFPPGAVVPFKGGRAEQGPDYGSGGQVRITYDQKPPPNVLEQLRDAGFHWNPATRSWVIEAGNGGRAKAIEILGLNEPVPVASAAARITELEGRIKTLETEKKGKRAVKRAGLSAQIRTYQDMIRKLEPRAEALRRQTEEAGRQAEAAKTIARGAGTEEALARVAFTTVPEQAQAAEVMRRWVRAEAQRQGVAEPEIVRDLENEAFRFYVTGDLELGLPPKEKTSMREFVAKAADPLRMRAGLKEIGERIEAALKDQRDAGAYATDYTIGSEVSRILKEQANAPPLERLAAVRREIEPRIARLHEAARSKRAEGIQKETEAELARWKSLLENTQEWEKFHAVQNPYLKIGFDGGFVTEDSTVITDGRELVKKNAVVGKGPLTYFEKLNDAARYGQGNPLPKRSTDAVWEAATKGKGSAADIEAVVGPEDPKNGYTLAYLRRRDNGQVAAVDANRLRAIMRATKADGVLVSGPGHAVVITKESKPVAVLMPITLDIETNAKPETRMGMVSSALEGGVAEIRRVAAERMRQAEAARDEKLRALGHAPALSRTEPKPADTLPPAKDAAATTEPTKLPDGSSEDVPKDIREFPAFPGGLLDPVYREAGKLIQRFRRTPPLQAGAAPVPTAGWTEKAVARYVDYFEPVARLERAVAGERRPGEAELPDLEDAYLQETLRRGKTLHGPRGLLWLEREHQKPILQLMRSKRIGMDELDEFLMARNAHAGNELIRKRNPEAPELTRYGMTDAEAAEILRRVHTDPRAAAFEELGNRFDKLNSDTLARHVDSGRMTQEQVDTLQAAQPHYAPARTDMSGPNGEPIQVPAGARRIGRAAKPALGRQSRAEFPLAFAFAQAEQAIVQGEMNGVRQAFARMVAAHQDKLGDAAKIVEVPMQRVLGRDGLAHEVFDPFFRGRNDVVVAWEKGKPIGVQIAPEHADLARAMNQLGPAQVEGLTRLVAQFNRIRSGLITRYRPFFWPFNLIRDVKSATYLGSEFGARFAARTAFDVPKALLTLAGKETSLTPMLERYRQAGAPISFMDLSSLSSQLDDMQRELAAPQASTADKTLEGFRRIKAALNTASDIGENATRFAAFVHAVEDLGWTDARAAAYAKELQNFERKGINGNAVNAWYLFANAGIQSSRRFAQAMRNPAVRRMVAASFVAAVSWDALQRTLGGKAPDGRDWWDHIPDYEKQGNFVFLYPDESGRRVNLPAPFVFGALNYTGQQLGALLGGHIKPGEFMSSAGAAWVNAVNPFGNIAGEDGSGVLRALTPDIARLPLEIATNRDWRGKPVYPEKGKGPDTEAYWPDVNPAAKTVAQWMGSATGGTKYEPGMVDVSPETLQHVAEYFGSGLPQDVVSVVGTARKVSQGETVPGREVPLLKRILREPSPFASWSEQEDLLDTLKAEEKRLKDEHKGLPREATTVLHIGEEVAKERAKKTHPKTGTPVDALPEGQRQAELQKLDLAAQAWNRRAREALKKLGR